MDYSAEYYEVGANILYVLDSTYKIEKQSVFIFERTPLADRHRKNDSQ